MIALIKKRKTVNDLLDDSGLINIPAKNISVSFLDPKIAVNPSQWHLLHIGLPLMALLPFGLLFGFLRKKK